MCKLSFFPPTVSSDLSNYPGVLFVAYTAYIRSWHVTKVMISFSLLCSCAYIHQQLGGLISWVDTLPVSEVTVAGSTLGWAERPSRCIATIYGSRGSNYYTHFFTSGVPWHVSVTGQEQVSTGSGNKEWVVLKVALSFPMNTFPKTNSSRKYHTHFKISASYEESVLSLKEKTTQHWWSCFQIALKYFKNLLWLTR